MENKVKWYNDPQMVGTLLLFWPPIGIYALYKSETIETLDDEVSIYNNDMI